MRYASGAPIRPLRERGPGGDGDEARAAAMVRGSLVPRDPDASELARISEALASPGRGRKRRRVVLRLALAGICIIAGGASVKAYEHARRVGWLGGSPAPATPTPPRTPGRARGPKRLAGPTAVPAPLPVAEVLPDPALSGELLGEAPVVPPAPAAPRAAARAAQPSLAEPVPRTRAAAPERELAALRHPDRAPAFEPPAPPLPAAAPPQMAPAPPSPLPAVSDEVRAMDRALGYLRREHDAVAALAALDDYLARYPRGALRREADLARIDALLILGRNDEALRALEVTTFDPGLRSTELLVVRAELRAATDCRRAGEDFTAALGRSPDAKLLARIFYGRGACRVRLQDSAGASDDLGRYLERFPAGAHADVARRWLAGQPARAENRR